jgi:hypothetical protein
VQFLKNIKQARRELHSLRDREGKAHSLARSMIRVLSKNNNLDSVERGRVESIEDQVGRRVYGHGSARARLGLEKLAEVQSIGLLKLSRKRSQPRLLHQQLRQLHMLSFTFTCSKSTYYPSTVRQNANKKKKKKRGLPLALETFWEHILRLSLALASDLFNSMRVFCWALVGEVSSSELRRLWD